jgi:hypothetical protein
MFVKDTELLWKKLLVGLVLTDLIGRGTDDNEYPPGVKGLNMNRVYHWRAFGRMERFFEQK